jgi:3-hydroxybutyrate dehydrogenase
MTKSKSLEGKHALVTGGSRGIGYAIAQRLTDMGASVTLVGRGVESLEQAVAKLADSGQVAYASGDISQQADVRRVFGQAKDRFGPVDILINNAGQAVSERFDKLDEAGWQQMIAVNLTGTFHCMQAALTDMLERRWGRIVNVASTAGLIGYPYVSAYCAAKHGVIGLTRALALETATKGVTVNAVCPGYTETEIVHEAIANITQKTGMSAEQAMAKLAGRNPQGRLIQPGEVADAVAWLCQPGAAGISGQAIPVDGGEVMVG